MKLHKGFHCLSSWVGAGRLWEGSQAAREVSAT